VTGRWRTGQDVSIGHDCGGDPVYKLEGSRNNKAVGESAPSATAVIFAEPAVFRTSMANLGDYDVPEFLGPLGTL